MKAALALALALPLTVSAPKTQPVALNAPLSASGWFSAYQVPLPPIDQRADAFAEPVYFTDQETIDRICGGKDQVIACTQVGGGMMALPNPCQPRFAGESYAAVVCHEKGHILGWRHG